MGACWGLRRASALLGALLGLAACVAQPGTARYAASAPTNPGLEPAAAPPGRRIGVLLPLTGPSAELGKSLLRAARLSLTADPAAAFDEIDTKGTPQGAADAVRAAASAGAGIIVGPLTAGETASVAALARPRGIPVLALTSDPAQAQPGVWPLGITPLQQVRPLLLALRAGNMGRVGAALPRNPFGDALADALTQTAAELGLPPPQVARYQSGGTGLDAAIASLGGPPGGPPPLDAVLFGTTAEATVAALPALSRAGLGPDRVRLLGTALWGRDPSRFPALAGAWFAGPSRQTLGVFEQSYTAKYGQPPRDLGGIAFDAAAAAKAVTGPGGVDVNTLVNPSGFAGANGIFVLLPDGRVRRSLELFQITAGGLQPLGAVPGS